MKKIEKTKKEERKRRREREINKIDIWSEKIM